MLSRSKRSCKNVQDEMVHLLAECHDPSDLDALDTSLGGHLSECDGCLRTYVGRVAEERFFRAWGEASTLDYPWFLRIERGNKADDMRGVDAVMHTTNLGCIYIQIKSSYRQIPKFRGRYSAPSIITVVVRPTAHSYEAIRRETVRMLDLYRRWLDEMSRPG